MRTEKEIKDELAKCHKLRQRNQEEYAQAVKDWNKEKMKELDEEASYLAYRSGTLKWVLGDD